MGAGGLKIHPQFHIPWSGSATPQRSARGFPLLVPAASCMVPETAWSRQLAELSGFAATDIQTAGPLQINAAAAVLSLVSWLAFARWRYAIGPSASGVFAWHYDGDGGPNIRRHKADSE